MPLSSARQCAGRSSELAYITQRLDWLKQGIAVKECVINVYGSPGIGKTALLAALGSIGSADPGIATFTLDVAASLSGSDFSAAKVRLLKAIQAEYLPPFDHALDQQLDHTGDERAIDTALAHVVEYLASLDKPLLLLLDSWQWVSEALLSWVERMLLMPLLQTERVLCVLGSQKALRWRQFEVRRRATIYLLGALDLAATQDQIDSPVLAKAIFTLSMGHPLANEVVLVCVKQEDDPITALQQRRTSIMQNVIGALYEHVVVEMTPTIEHALSVGAVFRSFDITLLEAILPQFFPEYQHYSQSMLFLLIKRLRETELVTWNDEIRRYQLDPIIRNLFAQIIQLNNPERYQALQDAAVEYYARRIGEATTEREVDLLEYYYHVLYKVNTSRYNTEQVQRSFEHIVRQHYMTTDRHAFDPAALGRLRTLIEHDTELQQAFAARGFAPTFFRDIIIDLETAAVSWTVE